MKRKIILIVVSFSFLLTSLLLAQDPEGALDSAYVICGTNKHGGSDTIEVSFQLWYSSDNTGSNKINGIAMPVVITGNGIVSVDTTVAKAFAGSGVGHFNLLAVSKGGNPDPAVSPFQMKYGAVNLAPPGVTGDSLFVNACFP
jgi:hypothetical protein